MNAANRRIGIWKQQISDIGSSFVRDKELKNEWRYWCDREEIPAVSSCQRIVLLGESVARGYFLDPDYTPAKVLQHLMSQFAYQPFEVVDLARTNLEFPALLKILKESVVLQPAAIVLFAGNNWIFEAHKTIDVEELPELTKQINEKGLNGLIHFLEARISAMINSFLEEARAIAEEYNSKLIFVIPEYNLRHWHQPEQSADVYGLENDDLQLWKTLTEEATEIKNSDNFKRLKELGELLCELDPVSSYGYQLAGRGCEGLGLIDEARNYYQKELDCTIICRFIGKPKIVTGIKQAIIDACGRLGIETIDTAGIFKTAAGGIPDRSMFMDYCHLSPLGIQLAMSHTCKALLKTVCSKDIELTLIKQRSLLFELSNSRRAMAHLLAAIHNAHYGQEPDIISFHCKEAVKADSGVAEFIEAFTEMVTMRAPNYLCKQYQQVIAMTEAHRRHTDFQYGTGKKLADVELIDTMVGALENRGAKQHEKIKQLRRKQHGINIHRSVNLLEFYYAQPYYRHALIDFLQPVHLFREIETISKFRLFADPFTNLTLILVCRVPHANGNDHPMKITINGTVFQSVSVGAGWQTFRLPVPGKFINRDVNTICIHWPLVPRKMNFNNVKNLMSICQYVNPVIGEIHQFSAMIS